jgi:hypothetical protein
MFSEGSWCFLTAWHRPECQNGSSWLKERLNRLGNWTLPSECAQCPDCCRQWEGGLGCRGPRGPWGSCDREAPQGVRSREWAWSVAQGHAGLWAGGLFCSGLKFRLPTCPDEVTSHVWSSAEVICGECGVLRVPPLLPIGSPGFQGLGRSTHESLPPAKPWAWDCTVTVLLNPHYGLMKQIS